MEKVRWGVIGAGRIAHTFCQDIALVEHAELVAIASRSTESATNFAQRYGVPTAYGNYQSLFNDDNIDAVYVATPHNFHYPQCKQALLAGKHVLCEKPFTVSSDECITLSRLAKEKGLFLMEAVWTYFLPAMQQAKAWFEQGRIGELVQINADFGYPVEYSPDKREYDQALNGGCLLEMGIYPIAFANFFANSQASQIHCEATFAKNGVEDDLSMLIRYPNVIANLSTSFRARLPNWGFVIGTEGYIAIPDFFRASKCSLHVLDDQIDSYTDERKGSGFEFQIDAASRSILNGQIENDVMTLQQSLTIQKMMEAVLLNISSER